MSSIAINPFTLLMGLFAYAIVVCILTLVMHFLMPKQVLERYFKPPYFREIECRLFSGLPYAPIRTVMFMVVFAFPRRGKRRSLSEAFRLVPKWYRVVSAIVVVSYLSIAVVIISVVLGYYAYQAFHTVLG